MTAPVDPVYAVLARYPAVFRPDRVESLGNAGGYSGARFWRLKCRAGRFCLRCWPPEHPTPQRLAAIHAVLLDVAANGLGVVPTPITDSQGQSFIEFDGSLWELTPWLPGEANYHREPTRRKLESACKTLARFHCLAATSPRAENRVDTPQGIVERRDLLGQLLQGGLQQIASAIQHGDRPLLDARASRLLDLFPRLAGPVADQLNQAGRLAIPLQPCIRDIWHDHVLFVGEEVTGIVDFGAMRCDHVATDIARLLGSFVRDDPERWRIGLAAYQQIRPLTEKERWLVRAYDVSSVLLSGMNWLRWIYIDGRDFERMDVIVRRLDENIERLERCAKGALPAGS